MTIERRTVSLRLPPCQPGWERNKFVDPNTGRCPPPGRQQTKHRNWGMASEDQHSKKNEDLVKSRRSVCDFSLLCNITVPYCTVLYCFALGIQFGVHDVGHRIVDGGQGSQWCIVIGDCIELVCSHGSLVMMSQSAIKSHTISATPGSFFVRKHHDLGSR